MKLQYIIILLLIIIMLLIGLMARGGGRFFRRPFFRRWRPGHLMSYYYPFRVPLRFRRHHRFHRRRFRDKNRKL